MAVPNENVAIAVGEISSSKPSTLHNPDADSTGDNHNVHLEKPVQGLNDDLYPHGLKLAILVGASISAVFLISLDQVSTLPTYTDI